MLKTQHELTIQALANSGDGVGRLEGRVVFVPYSCPGDRLLVQIVRVQKNYLRARIEKILEPSADRTNPPCEYFGSCGGCDWQHIQYQTQLLWKLKNLEDVLTKIAKFDSLPISPIIESPKKFYYRNRIQVQYDAKGFYLYKKASRERVAIHQCPIADEKINENFAELHQKSLSMGPSGRVELAINSDHVSSFPADNQSQTDFGFRQVNSEQNLILKNKINELVRLKKAQQVIDLYCGQGNWALNIAEEFPDIPVLGIESNPINIKRAEQAAEKLPSPPAFLLGKVETTYQNQRGEKALVIIDPPRAGCSDTLLDKLVSHPAQWLVYISCHPATMARDLLTLKKQYQLVEIQPVDMFPQTAHLECLILLHSDRQVNTDH